MARFQRADEMMEKRIVSGYVKVETTGGPVGRSWWESFKRPEQISDAAYAKYVRDEYKSEGERIIAEIRRHVDDCSCEYIVETEEVCEWCGADWTEDADSPHNGGCCQQDREVMEMTDGG